MDRNHAAAIREEQNKHQIFPSANDLSQLKGEIDGACEALAPQDVGAELLTVYSDGPLVSTPDKTCFVEFLCEVVRDVARKHAVDPDMRVVDLFCTIENLGEKSKQFDVVFTYSRQGFEGSVSFSLSCVQGPTGDLMVFGDEEFRGLG